MTTPATKVDALRATWRKTAEQRAAQLWRFLRLFISALVAQIVAQVVANGGDLNKISHLDQKAVVSLLVAAAEAAWRQFHPALTASQVNTAPGATITVDPLSPAPTTADGGGV